MRDRSEFIGKRFDETDSFHHPVVVMYTDQFDDGNAFALYWGCNEYRAYTPEEIVKISKYILENIKNEDTKILFEQPWEGFTRGPLIELHKLIKTLSLNPKNCFFVTCGLEARRFYDDLCIEYGIPDSERVRIIVINQWENGTHNRSLPEPVFSIAPKKNFLCFNRMNRLHRTALLGLLWDRDLVKESLYSFHPKAYGCELRNMLDDYLPTQVSFGTCVRIQNQFREHYSELPLILNLYEQSENINWIRHEDVSLFETTQFSLVTETFFFDSIVDESSVFFSEKIFKPIAQKHPFIMLNRPHALSFLRKMGYKTFHPFINEEFDAVDDCERRLIMIVDEVERLCKQTPEEWSIWQRNVKGIVEHNYKIFTSKSREDYIFEVL